MDYHVIEVGTINQKAFIRVRGRGDFQNSQAMKDFVLNTLSRGISEVLIDLKECKTMDSTFMGVLAGIAIQLKNKHQKKLTLFHVEDHNLKLLTTLGIHIFMQIIPNGLSSPEDLEKLPSHELSKEAMAREMLDAHAVLMDISEENRVKFKDVYEFLKEEIKKASSPI